jgi:hypothetical protein
MATLRDIYLADKRIGFFPGRAKPEVETDYIWFDAPIEIGGVSETGLVLHGGCYAHRPDVNVSFELRISRSPGKHSVPIERFDWRDLKGGHTNPRKPRSQWSGRRVGDTHLHEFELNWSETEQRLRAGGLVFARDVDQIPQTFEEVRDLVGKRLRINNIDVVSRPDWVYDLFP